MLKHRIVSGLLFGTALVLAANFLPALGGWLVLLALSSVAQLEFYDIANRAGMPVFRRLGIVAGAALITVTFLTLGPDPLRPVLGREWENAVLLGTMIAVFIRQFPQKRNELPLPTLACTLLGVWYVPFLVNYLTRLAFAWDGTGAAASGASTGRLLILYLVIVVKCTDIGAYFVGTFLGRHKLFPRISPAKTWEGLMGGIAFAILMSCLFSVWTGGQIGRLAFGMKHAVALGGILAVAGVVGDMFESLLKRAAGAKDSGTTIPGFGGLLDVIDSLLFGAPVLYIYAQAFLQ
jgi:phosphatidate cytidylyltransferase